MKLLLDTHTLLWFIAGNSNLSPASRKLIEGTENEKFVSAASIWETAIKVSIGKMSLVAPFDDIFRVNLKSMAFREDRETQPRCHLR